MSDPFARLADNLRLRLGVQVLLRGTTETRAIIERGVATTGSYGEASLPRTFATLDRRVSPSIGDTLTVPETGESFVLDALETDDGYDMVFVLV